MRAKLYAIPLAVLTTYSMSAMADVPPQLRVLGTTTVYEFR